MTRSKPFGRNLRFFKLSTYAQGINALREKLGLEGGHSEIPSDRREAHDLLVSLEKQAGVKFEIRKTPELVAINSKSSTACDLDYQLGQNEPVVTAAKPTPEARPAAKTVVQVSAPPLKTTPAAPVIVPVLTAALSSRDRMLASFTADLNRQVTVVQPLAPFRPPNAFAPVATSASATAEAKPDRQTLLKIARVFPLVNIHDSQSDAEVFESLEKAAYQAGCRFRGMRSDEELSKIHWREDPSRVTGIGRTIRAMRQETITAIDEEVQKTKS